MSIEYYVLEKIILEVKKVTIFNKILKIYFPVTPKWGNTVVSRRWFAY
jgi:hypothetical protein